jgi:putative AdoMet-dependent methyltransferase
VPDTLEALRNADWAYNDLQHVGVDFADPVQVATYDARQRSTDAAAAQLLQALGVKPGDVLADIGCGTGVLACQAALLGCQVRAVDISEGMLSAARQRAERLGAQGMQFERAGFLSFASAPGSLDVVTTQYALHHLNDVWKVVALQRIHRALKPGGKLLLKDVVYSCEPDELSPTIEAWLTWMQQERGYSREENVAHVRDEHSTFAWIMEGLIERAGLRITDKTTARGVYASYVAVKP